MKVIILEKIKNFISNLDNRNRAKCKEYIGYLEHSGYELRPPYSKQIFPNIFELRVKSQLNIRLVYSFYKNNAVIFYYFIKTTQQISMKEINTIRRKYDNLQI